MKTRLLRISVSRGFATEAQASASRLPTLRTSRKRMAGALLAASAACFALPASASWGNLDDCLGEIVGARGAKIPLNPAFSRWDQDRGALARGGVIVSLTCWYGGTVPDLAVTAIQQRSQIPGVPKLAGTCGPKDAPPGLNENSTWKQVKATWYGSLNSQGASVGRRLIARLEPEALECPQERITATACNEWTLDLVEAAGDRLRWVGTWKKVPGSFSYTATWRSTANNFRPQPRTVIPVNANLDFRSDMPELPGWTIYYTRTQSLQPDPLYGIRGVYEIRDPAGQPRDRGTWSAVCKDPVR